MNELRHHLLFGLVKRIAGSPELVLRGGLLTQRWVAPLPRPTLDLDYVGDFPFDVDDTHARVSAALERPRDDGIRPVRVDARGIWLDTEFPGVRLTCTLGMDGSEGSEHTVQMDIGFHDPLVPPPMLIVIDGVEVRCVRPETQVAWKLHALAEMGGSFRPKDLADLWRITSSVPLDDALLSPAIVAAFESRGFAVTDAKELFDRPYWDTKSARVRWTPNRSGPGVPPLPKALGEVRERLRTALEACSSKAMGRS